MITAEVQRIPTPLPVDYDAEAASQPRPPPRPIVDKSNDGAVPEKPSATRRNVFYGIFVLFAMAITGVVVWLLVHSKTESSVPETAQVQPQPDDTASPFPVLVISDARPLSMCMGDCDDDTDCGPGLMCFQRSRNMEVPGCSGGVRVYLSRSLGFIFPRMLNFLYFLPKVAGSI